jgi:hypothetical protein
MSAPPHVDYNDDGAQYVLAFGKDFHPVGKDHQMSKWTAHDLPEVLDTPGDHDENNDADVIEDGGANDDGYNRHDVPDIPRNGGENMDGVTVIIDHPPRRHYGTRWT